MDIFPRIALIFLLVFLNGYFVASEFALVAVRKTRINELVNKGNKSARLVQKSIKNLDTFISATQLGITIASLALGWVGEPFVAALLQPHFEKIIPNQAALISAHAVSVTIAFSVITFLHIVLGELAPKSIALQKAEKVSLLIIAPLNLFATIFKPFIYVLNAAGILVLKTIGISAPSGHQLVHSEEEIKMILAESAEEGAIEKGEAEMVYSVLRLGDTPVNKIMIPRTRIIAFEKNMALKQIIKISQKYPHSRFPVYIGSLDNVVGFIHIKDVYRSLLTQTKIDSIKEFYWHFLMRNKDRSLADMKIIRDIPKISEIMKIDDVLLLMKEKRIHMAVVRDEFKGTSGIVTLEDVVESLVGEIHDEFEAPQNQISKAEKVKNLKSLIKIRSLIR